jgi:hypothetical protein
MQNISKLLCCNYHKAPTYFCLFSAILPFTKSKHIIIIIIIIISSFFCLRYLSLPPIKVSSTRHKPLCRNYNIRCEWIESPYKGRFVVLPPGHNTSQQSLHHARVQSATCMVTCARTTSHAIDFHDVTLRHNVAYY